MIGNIIKHTTLAIGISAVMMGCSTTGEKTSAESSYGSEDGSASTQGIGDQEGTVTTIGAGQDGFIAGKRQLTDEELRANKVFYFEFDQSSVSQEDYDAIAAHARYLIANPDRKVRVVGHADERGTREYNMALGEKRSISIAEILKVNGVTKQQLEVISYGEEAPAELGHDEFSWSKNRRVEVAYR